MPPGQYLTDGFPVLSAGPTPHTPLEAWTFSITQGGQISKSWTWQEFRALPAETITADIHCVTRWSKLDTQWRGVSVDMLLDQVEHDAPYVMAFCDGGYTTNLPIEDVTGGKAWVAWPGHRAGQYLDVRLTAEDGYTAEREYSITSASCRAFPACSLRHHSVRQRSLPALQGCPGPSYPHQADTAHQPRWARITEIDTLEDTATSKQHSAHSQPPASQKRRPTR